MVRARADLLLGEWACLGVLCAGPSHGFAIATRLGPKGDLGQVWSLSRPLTYRALDQLADRGYVEAVGEEPGVAGGNRVILAVTRSGRAQLRSWLGRPVAHVRDLRSELLLKLVIAEMCGVDTAPMLVEQRRIVQDIVDALAARADEAGNDDIVTLWRHEFALTALRFIDRISS